MVDRERQTAEQFCTVAQVALHNLGEPGEALQRRALKGVTQWGKKNLASLGKLTADHEAVGVEEVAQAGRGDSDMAAGIRNNTSGGCVPSLGAHEQVTQALHSGVVAK